MKQTVVAALIVIFGCDAARASSLIIASAPVYGSPSQSVFTCYITNTSSSTIPLKKEGIFNEGYMDQKLAANSCGSGVAPGETCSFDSVGVDNGSAIFCTAEATVTKNTASALRMTADVQDSSGNLLASEVGH